MTTELTKAAQQALEAWQTACYGQPSHQRAMLLAMTELRKMVERTTELSDRGHRDALLVARDAIEQEKALSHRAGYKQGYQQGKADALTQRPAAQTEREAFEAWWESDGPNTSSPYDAAMSGWNAGRASLPAPQQATPDLADGPARMHWTNWMPVKDALEYAYQKMGLEMVKTDAGAKYPNLHWNLAGLVREFVVAQQDAMFGKCQACGKNVGLLDQIKCLDCGTRLCEPCAKEHFGSDHGARAAASHSHPAPTTSGWVETSAPPQRLDWSDTQQATPEPHLFIGACITDGRLHATVQRLESNGNVTLVATAEMDAASLHGRDCMAQMTPATPEPVGEPVGTVVHATLNGQAKPWVTVALNQGADLPNGTKLFTRPAPGVPEGFALVPMEPTIAMLEAGRRARFNVDDTDLVAPTYRAMLAAAQAKGGAA